MKKRISLWTDIKWWYLIYTETSLQYRTLFYFVWILSLIIYLFQQTIARQLQHRRAHLFFQVQNKFRLQLQRESYGKKHYVRWSVELQLLEDIQVITRLCTLCSECQINLLMKRADYFCSYKALCLQVCPFSSKRKNRNKKRIQVCFLVHCKTLNYVLKKQWTDWATNPFLQESRAGSIQTATVRKAKILNAYPMK